MRAKAVVKYELVVDCEIEDLSNLTQEEEDRIIDSFDSILQTSTVKASIKYVFPR